MDPRGGDGMSTGGPPIPYASTGLDDPTAGRLLRRIVGWSAIAYGANGAVLMALYVALSRGWLATPPNMSWSLGGRSRVILTAIDALTDAALVVGGVLLLRRTSGSVLAVRGAAVVTLLLSLLSQAQVMCANPTYFSYWSTPGAAAVQTLGLLNGLWLPALLVLLTLPPLARRML